MRKLGIYMRECLDCEVVADNTGIICRLEYMRSAHPKDFISGLIDEIQGNGLTIQQKKVILCALELSWKEDE